LRTVALTVGIDRLETVGAFVGRRRPGAPGTGRTYKVGMCGAGAVLLPVGRWILIATA
jgi:hypothetical protein